MGNNKKAVREASKVVCVAIVFQVRFYVLTINVSTVLIFIFCELDLKKKKM